MTMHPIPRRSYAGPLSRDRFERRLASVLHAAALVALGLLMVGVAIQVVRFGVALSLDLPTVIDMAAAGYGT